MFTESHCSLNEFRRRDEGRSHTVRSPQIWRDIGNSIFNNPDCPRQPLTPANTGLLRTVRTPYEAGRFGDEVLGWEQISDGEKPVEHNKLVVMDVPGISAMLWDSENDENVAEKNPHYPPTNDVVVVLELDHIEEERSDWDERSNPGSADELGNRGIPYNVLPALRLVLDEPSHLRD